MLLINDSDTKRVLVRSEENRYEEVEWNEGYENGQFNGIIGLLYPNGTLKVQLTQNQQKMYKTPEIRECLWSDKEFYMRDCILNESAFAACDGSKKNNLFGRYCMLTDAGRSQSIRWKCSSNQWELNNVHTSEGYPFIMLMELIYKISYGLRRGKVVIYMDRRKLVKDMNSNCKKASIFSGDCGAIRSRFLQIKEKLEITIVVKFSNKETKILEQFKDNRGGFLIKECDVQSKLIRKRMENEEQDNNDITWVGNQSLVVNNTPCDRGIKELIRIIDSKQMLKQVYKDKFKKHHHLIDLEARNQFHGTTRSAIKCISGFNHYGARYSKINQDLPSK